MTSKLQQFEERAEALGQAVADRDGALALINEGCAQKTRFSPPEREQAQTLVYRLAEFLAQAAVAGERHPCMQP